MTQDRMSAADYRELTASKPVSHGSRRGVQGSAVGTCAVCGGRVSSSSPAHFHVDLDVEGRVAGRWVRHLECEQAAA